VEKLKAGYNPEKIQTGKFGAYMSVDSTNDGPITITMDSEIK